jgi:hypothetical protein
MKMLTEAKLHELLVQAWNDGYHAKQTYNDVEIRDNVVLDKQRQSDVSELMGEADKP